MSVSSSYEAGLDISRLAGILRFHRCFFGISFYHPDMPPVRDATNECVAPLLDQDTPSLHPAIANGQHSEELPPFDDFDELVIAACRMASIPRLGCVSLQCGQQIPSRNLGGAANVMPGFPQFMMGTEPSSTLRRRILSLSFVPRRD